MLRSVPHEFSSSAARQMVIAPSDEVGAAKAAATTRLPGSSLSRRYAIVITLQTKRRPHFGAPRKKPNLYALSFYLTFGVVKDSGCPRPSCGPIGEPADRQSYRVTVPSAIPVLARSVT